MNNDGLYHQPRWVNAIVIAGCVPVILSQYVVPKGLSQAFVLLAVPLLFLFVGICNRVRSGAFFPRWAERKRIAERLELPKMFGEFQRRSWQLSKERFQLVTPSREAFIFCAKPFNK